MDRPVITKEDMLRALEDATGPDWKPEKWIADNNLDPDVLLEWALSGYPSYRLLRDVMGELLAYRTMMLAAFGQGWDLAVQFAVRDLNGS